ncbi:HD domain-containing protein [Oceanirhabdus sp. W0125-5]|uniref:HD domain-containing protein n=1 Tax=Oceanirhabdus sp. W0125-5 TaxID=2999116 RepID=UPI0022F2F48E|nr:HD domain-containing protein [Oceanirhabdus sp. W0125-5]WBW99044.1 HD domain-containing protein [Oceanirhabdus sp. W0125-5]
MKKQFVNDLKDKMNVKSSFMIVKKLAREEGNLIAYVGDKTGDVKATLPDDKNKLEVGDIIYISGKMDGSIKAQHVKKEEEYNLEDYLPSIDKSIDKIIEEMRVLSDEVFKSEECKALDDYFFKNEEFVERFKKGIGGLRQHHNYLGGLAEHSLNAMYIAKTLAERYDIRHKEIAVLGAKLHDIGKIEEYFTNGPFSVTMLGEMEGHIVTGNAMIEEAFREGGDIYSEDFKMRMKSCILQHHGKIEYGSPKVPKTEEAYIVHLADYVDAIMNKIEQVRNITEPGEWSEYDRRIGTKLYM